MSIYPERNRSGSFTGRWIFESRAGGVRRRATFATFDEAKEAEEGIASAPRATGATLADLDRLLAPRAWMLTKDEVQSVARWRKALALLGPETPAAEVRKVKLEELADRLRAEGLGPKTINRYLATVSRVLRLAHEADMIPARPAIPWQRESEGSKRFLPEHLTEPFLEACGEFRFPAEVLLLTGMRVSELLTLNPDEVIDDVIHLSRTKTGRPRAIPLPEGRGAELRRWLAEGGCAYRPLLEAISRAGEACGVPLTPHALRHTTATRLIAKGVPSLTVAQLMGHSSLATTRGYTHHAVDDLRKAVAVLEIGQCGATKLSSRAKTEVNQRRQPPARICSPLRSHSATRPK